MAHHSHREQKPKVTSYNRIAIDSNKIFYKLEFGKNNDDYRMIFNTGQRLFPWRTLFTFKSKSVLFDNQ